MMTFSEKVRCVLVAGFLGPLIGTFIYNVIYVDFIAFHFVYFLSLIYLAVWFVPSGLIGGFIMVEWRRRSGSMDVIRAVISGFLGGFIPAVLIVGLVLPEAFWSGTLMISSLGAVTAFILWCSRGMFGLKGL
ncbi:hypothetical protein [Ahrensia kielensis]|uniref:hypothetical protein n=1 Tax=Ahrensia kielensis TaxID=76980 RepID=UPI0003637A4A|nr:hypothetical protein [Ahrensia kielensis]